MTSNTAWKRHGCYKLGSAQYFNMPLGKALIGCYDDWNALDHFDPTADPRRLFSQFNYLRTVYGSLQDGFDLVQRGNWTYLIQLPGSNGTATEKGLWSVSRAGIQGVQTLGGIHQDQVWLLYTNENVTKSYSYDCSGTLWISSPYMSGTQVQNLFHPYETYTLAESLSSYYNNSQAPWYGCLPNVTMDPYGFKALVPVNIWVPPRPALTRFVPGHDFRLLATPGDPNATSIDISLEFNTVMDCTSVTSSITLSMSSSGKGGNATITNVTCGAVQNPAPSLITGVSISAWAWSATLQNVPDGVLTITVDQPSESSGNQTTEVRSAFVSSFGRFTTKVIQAIDHLLLRKGASDNVVIFPESDYDTSGAFTFSNGQYSFTHKALGADQLRYSWNFGKNWSDWQNWEDTTLISQSTFQGSDLFWQGNHIVVQCQSSDISCF